jgi:hypothetical protein
LLLYRYPMLARYLPIHIGGIPSSPKLIAGFSLPTNANI